MKTIDQISIFLENKPGALGEMLDCIGAQGTNILAMSIADTTDFGIVRLVVAEPAIKPLLAALIAAGFIAKCNPVVGVSIPNEPGSLAGVLGIISGANIQVEYAYSMTKGAADDAVIVLQTSDNAACTQAFEAAGINLVANTDIA